MLMSNTVNAKFGLPKKLSNENDEDDNHDDGTTTRLKGGSGGAPITDITMLDGSTIHLRRGDDDDDENEEGADDDSESSFRKFIGCNVDRSSPAYMLGSKLGHVSASFMYRSSLDPNIIKEFFNSIKSALRNIHKMPSSSSDELQRALKQCIEKIGSKKNILESWFRQLDLDLTGEEILILKEVEDEVRPYLDGILEVVSDERVLKELTEIVMVTADLDHRMEYLALLMVEVAEELGLATTE